MHLDRGVMLGLSIVVCAGLRVSSVADAQTANPSFDCEKATKADERAICSDSRLAELDQAMAIAFGQVKNEFKSDARQQAKETLAGRRSCGAARLCILDQQVSAIGTFADLGARVPIPPWVGTYRLQLITEQPNLVGPDLPKVIGHCTITKIASISTRFGDELKMPTSDLDNGSAVSFANKGSQVSYSYVASIAASHIGDEVLVCLVSLPKNCPLGDERGRVYSTTNLKTKDSWILPDAQHMCGGA